MKFCMVTTFYPPYNFGGDGIYVEALSHELVHRGHEVTVVHCTDAFALVSGRRDVTAPPRVAGGVRVVRLHSAWGPLSPLLTQQTGYPLLKRRQLAATLAEGHDVVHFHNISLVGGPGVLALPAGDALKLYTLHEHWLLCSTHIFWKNREQACDQRDCLRCCIRSRIPPQAWRATGMIERSVRHVDALIAPSEFTAARHRDAGLPVPIVVNPLFARVRPADDGAPVPRGEHFVFVGRITPSKGVRPMLQQFAAHPEFQLRLAGDGEALAALRSEFGRCAHIHFLGPVGADALPALYAGARAVILPSLAPETFGLTVVEGMAFGTPALVHDAGGCREIVERSGAGHVFTDFTELPALLHRLVSDGAHWQQLSDCAREATRTQYHVEHHLSRYLGLIAELQARRQPKAAA